LRHLKTLQQKKANLVKENSAILDKAGAEARALTTEEQATYDKNKNEITSLNSTMKTMHEQAEAEASLTGAAAAAVVESVTDLSDTKFKSFAEQLIAVSRSAQTNGTVTDPRLIAVGSDKHRKLMAAATGLNEAVPAEGGFLVQTDFAEGLLNRTYETGRIMGMCSEIEVSSPSNRVVINAIDEQSRANGSRFGGVQAFWANEADTIGATKPKFRRLELILNKLTAACFATDELLADATALESVINDVFPQEFAFRIEDAIVNGVGNGQPLGILNANNNALVVVNKEAGQAANTVVAANVMKMWSRCWGRSRMNAVWLYDQSIEPQLYSMTLPNAGVATPIYLPPTGLAGAPYGTLFGRPIFPTEYNAALSSQGDIVLADFSQYKLARKSVLQAASSMHVNFLKDETCFRFIMRLDGQPQWNTSLQPKSNSGNLSPFVTLQAR
jgi:HK97 family phage major capsid protein